MKSEEVENYAIDFYSDVGCYEEIDRISWTGLTSADYDIVGFEVDLCTTDIDIILEENEYTFRRDNIEIVNVSNVYLFSKERKYE